MKATKITLEDKGQDFLRFYVDENQRIIAQEPFGNAFVGAMIPLDNQALMKVGKSLPIHNPPYIILGYLRYDIEKIEQVDYEPKA